MQKKLTVTIDEEVYEGLRKVIGPRKISRFIKKEIYTAYKEMAADEVRESEALEWAEATFGDVNPAGAVSKTEMEGIERAIIIQLAL